MLPCESECCFVPERDQGFRCLQPLSLKVGRLQSVPPKADKSRAAFQCRARMEKSSQGAGNSSKSDRDCAGKHDQQSCYRRQPEFAYCKCGIYAWAAFCFQSKRPAKRTPRGPSIGPSPLVCWQISGLFVAARYLQMITTVGRRAQADKVSAVIFCVSDAAATPRFWPK